MADARSFIQDIPISGKVKKRTTGIVGLNLLLDGGYPEGTLVMMYGTPVSGIDLAAMQFWKAEGGEEGTYFMNDGDVEVGMIDATDLHPGIVHHPDGRQQDSRGFALNHHRQIRG